MLVKEDISDFLSLPQGYEYINTYIAPDGKQRLLHFKSSGTAGKAKCPYCGGQAHVCGSYSTQLRDMPVYANTRQDLRISYHRYRCTVCSRTFREEIPFKHPGTRITERAAAWISSLLRFSIPISSIQSIAGIHWDTIKGIHRNEMDRAISDRMKKLREEGYKPRHLAVDEFAIHKRHRYATCVMDLDRGDVLWAGKGRTKEDFGRFFQDMDMGYLSEVEAVAMDMNASYNMLVRQYLPAARIVYDRYHMQAQFGREVIGAVRLEEARRHKSRAMQLANSGAAKSEIRKEKELYSEVKRARWILLSGMSSIPEHKLSALNSILDSHADLAICHSMKEEMCRLFDLTDRTEAEKGWKAWFAAAMESAIPPLVRFAQLKEKRIDGLIAHASYPISTGKIEGFNNRIKVAKRIGYGYRDEGYFFSLIRYISIPSLKPKSHKKT